MDAAQKIETPTCQTRSERLEARVPADLKSRLAQAAELSGRSLTNFVVSSADERARQIIREHEVMTLSAADSRAFVSALLEDAEPSNRLKTAARKHRQRTGR